MAVANRLANLPNEPDQEPQVVDRREPVSQDLAGHEEVAQIRSAKPLARIAIATLLDSSMFCAIARRFDVYAPIPGKQAAMTGYSRG